MIQKNYISEFLERKMITLNSSWQWIKPEFAEEFANLVKDADILAKDSYPKIWGHNKNFVLLVDLPSKRKVVYKCSPKMRQFPYMYYYSQTAREALNYQRFINWGFPMVKLLATGDVRKFLRPQSCFLVTEYADGFIDGRCAFVTGDEFSSNESLKDIFCRKNFALLAKLHDLRIYHRGFMPHNILVKIRDNNDMEIAWIDVATCKKLPTIFFKRHIADDFMNFFRFFDFSKEQRFKYIKHYFDNLKKPLFDLDTLSKKVEKRLAQRRVRDAKKQAKRR